MSSPQDKSKDTKGVTGLDLLRSLRPQAVMPPYVGGGHENPNVRAERIAKEKAEAEARQKNLQLRDSAPRTSHPAIRTSFPLPSSVAEVDILKRLPLKEIVETAATIFEMKPSELLSKSRAQEISRPRQVVAYFMTRYAHCTIEAVAKALNFRGYSSVNHARDRMESLLEFGPTDEVERQMLVGLRKLCEHYGKPLPLSAHWPEEKATAKGKNPFGNTNAS